MSETSSSEPDPICSQCGQSGAFAFEEPLCADCCHARGSCGAVREVEAPDDRQPEKPEPLFVINSDD